MVSMGCRQQIVTSIFIFSFVITLMEVDFYNASYINDSKWLVI
jgi:hypothetical protein